MKPFAIVNEYGNFDLAHNKLPKRYVHISGLRLQPLCRSLGIRYCDAVVEFEQYRTGCYTPVKDGVIVTAASESKLRAAIADRESRTTKAKRRAEVSKKRKSEEFEQSLRVRPSVEVFTIGCQSLFKLNRIAKLRACDDFRDAIYYAKSHWINALYEYGFCDRCERHETQTKQRLCFGCIDGVDHDGRECERCDGTGIFAESQTLQYIVFSFNVDGTRYTWHQPRESVIFEFQLTSEEPVSFEPDGPKVEMIPLNDVMALMKTLTVCVKLLATELKLSRISRSDVD